MIEVDLGSTLVSSLFLVTILAIGWATKRNGWFGPDAFSTLSTVCIRITLPAALLTMANELILGLDTAILIATGVLYCLSLNTIGWLQTRKASRQERGFAILNTAGANIGLFAMPYLQGIIGPTALLPALAFDTGNGTVAGGIGYAWGVTTAQPGRGLTIRALVRKTFSGPVFQVYLVIMTLRLLDLQLPEVVVDFTSLVGQANTFLAMFMLGVGLQLRLPRSGYAVAARILTTRLLVAVVLSVITWFWLPLDRDTAIILCAVFFSPVPSMVTPFTLEARGDVTLSAFIVSASILMSLVLIPVVLIFLSGAPR